MKKGISKSFRGFSMIELLACIAIVAVLVALIFPAYTKITSSGKRTQCVSNQKSIVSGILMSAGDNDGRLPAYGRLTSPSSVDSGRYWWEVVKPYLIESGNPALGIGYNYLRCPAAAPLPKVTTTIGVNYGELAGRAPFGFEGFNFPGSMKLSQMRSSTVLIADIVNPDGQMWFLSPNEYPLTQDTDKDGVMDSHPSNSFVFRHNNTTVVGLADGSARIVTKREWGRNEGRLWGP